jgi:ribonucleoside-diphosphate reductase alpha chain
LEYVTYEGKKSIFLTVNYIEVEGEVGGKKIKIKRPIEFFVPSGQQTTDMQWVSASMRLLSLVARSGGNIDKALDNLREVIWDKGTVRCSTFTTQDGIVKSKFHDSEVAALAYVLQDVVREITTDTSDMTKVSESQGVLPLKTDIPPQVTVSVGKKCPECGAHAVQKVDGCERCIECGYLGSCG